MEPKDKDSVEWKDWFVRHKFGPMTAVAINGADVDELDILLDYVRHVREKKGRDMALEEGE
ncbi:MAG: hypothetical protein GY846_12980 [Deltaproteobacteria bacterium]|nr:hypothetical protein [Deltaproteobacteria bacterium]